MSVPKDIRKVFDTLECWRHLPAYQLERRVDIFFAIYLPYVLKVCCNAKIKEYLVPEFPIKQDGSNRSDKADYLAISEDSSRVFLIEVKTDIKSRRKDQDNAYQRAKNMGLSRLVDGIISIRHKTKQPRKYDNLFDLLAKLDLVGVEAHQRKIVMRYRNMVGKSKPSIEVLYIQPKNYSSEQNVITFRQFADKIEGHGDVAALFAGHLRCWANVEAGDQREEFG